jgi:hypothetical protein
MCTSSECSYYYDAGLTARALYLVTPKHGPLFHNAAVDIGGSFASVTLYSFQNPETPRCCKTQ